MIKPQNLVKGDKVAIVSLSRGLLGKSSVKHELDLAIRRLKEYGLEPVIMPNAMGDTDYLSNYPEARAADLKKAYQDENIKMILCAIGGNDTYRLLPYLMEDDEFKKAVIEKINSHNLTIDIYFKDKKFHFFVPYDIDYYLNAYYFSIIRENTSIIEMKNLYLERFFHTQSEYEKKLETVLSIYEIKNGEEVLLDELSLVNGFVTKYLLSTKKEDILLSIKGGIDSEEEITIRNLENVFDLQVSLELQELLQRSRTIMPKNRRLL